MFVSSQTVDNLALLDVAAVNAALSGAFDSRIAELRGLLAKVAEQDAKVKTLAEAEQIKAAAAVILDNAKKAEADVAAQNADLAAREEWLQEEKTKFFAADAAFISKVAKFEDDCAVFVKNSAASNAALADAQAAVEAEKARLADERNALEAEKAAFNAKLAALKV